MPVNRFERISDKHYRSTYVQICRHCKGSGLWNNTPFAHPCPVCDGTGRVVITKEIYINVEPFNT